MNAKSSTGSAWFWIAVQALVVIAESEGACPSGTIAHDLKAHAVFLRRVLAQLVRAEIIEAHEGRDGGYQLIRSAEQVLLSEVYQATRTVNQAEEHKCIRSTNVPAQITLAKVKQELEQNTLEVLSHYTIASLIQHEDAISEEHLLF